MLNLALEIIAGIISVVGKAIAICIYGTTKNNEYHNQYKPNWPVSKHLHGLHVESRGILVRLYGNNCRTFSRLACLQPLLRWSYGPFQTTRTRTHYALKLQCVNVSTRCGRKKQKDHSIKIMQQDTTKRHKEVHSRLGTRKWPKSHLKTVSDRDLFDFLIQIEHPCIVLT